MKYKGAFMSTITSVDITVEQIVGAISTTGKSPGILRVRAKF